MVTVEYAAEERHDIVSGILKFSDQIPIPLLLAFASNWKQEAEGNLLSVSIRGCAKDMNGIDFKLQFEGDDYRPVMHAIGREVEKYFEKKHFRGWSVSSPTYIIK